jgi:hypothetical protein
VGQEFLKRFRVGFDQNAAPVEFAFQVECVGQELAVVSAAIGKESLRLVM